MKFFLPPYDLTGESSSRQNRVPSKGTFLIKDAILTELPQPQHRLALEDVLAKRNTRMTMTRI